MSTVLINTDKMANDVKASNAALEKADNGIFTEVSPLLERKVEECNSTWRNYLPELCLFTYMFSVALPMNCTAKLYMERACVTSFNRTIEECNGNDTNLYDEIQIVANNYSLCSTVIRILPSAILSIFIGPWTDKYGRKPPIHVALFGTIVSGLGLVWFVYSPRAPLYYVLIATIPSGISGGILSVLMSFYTMASEKTKTRSRTTKYAVLEFAFALGIPLGTLSSGFISTRWGFFPVYVLSVGLCVALFLVFFFLSEEESPRLKASLKTKMLDLFSCEGINDNFKTVMKKRENRGRAQIILLSAVLFIVILNYIALVEILYMFCNKMYKWSLLYYSEVSAVGSTLGSICIVILVPLLSRRWNVSDQWMGIIGVLALLSSCVVRAFSYYQWMFYLSLLLGLPNGMASLAVRSRLSKIVERTELGKVFSMVAIVESVVPIVGSLLITQVYNASIDFFPGLPFLVAGVTLVFPLTVFWWIMKLPEQYEDIKEFEQESVTQGSKTAIN